MSGDVVLIAGRDPRDEVSGGHSAYVRSYARAAIAAGFTPHLFCAAADSSVTATELGVVHRIRSPYRPFRQMLAALHARPLAAAIARFGESRVGDGSRARLLIHGFGVWGVAGVRAAALLKRRGVEAVLLQSSYTTYRDEALSHVRGAAVYSLRSRLRFLALWCWVAAVVESWERRAYRSARVILVNYDSVAALIVKRHGELATIRRMPYAAENAFFDEAPAARLPGVTRIGSVARHEPRKGIDVLLHSLARLKRDGVAFHARLAGGGPLLDEDRHLAYDLGLDGCVTVEGIVPDVRTLLRDADLFVLPSREEQSGSLAVLEALQAGCAIVATRIDGLRDDLTDGRDALLVDPDDSGALAAALARLASDRPLRRRLQQGARATFERRFAAAPFAEALGAIYRELA